MVAQIVAQQAPASQTLPPHEAVPQSTTAESNETISKAVEESVDAAVSFASRAVDFIGTHVLTEQVALQAVILVLSGMLAALIAKSARQILNHVWPMRKDGRFRRLRRVIDGVVMPAIWSLLLWFGSTVAATEGFNNEILRAAASLLSAWVLIRLFSSLVRNPLWAKTFAAGAWAIAALNILHLLDPTIALLDSFAVNLGQSRLSLYAALKGLLFAGLLIWLAGIIARTVQQKINSATALTPSVQTLISQSVRLLLLFGAVVIALGTIGVDLTVLTVFSGAVGVGVGFGLQSVFSNLVAGIILVFERSIRVGDFVELAGGVRGTVREITIRSTLVTTNDNIDILVPNSEFITKQMTNWTLRDALRRFRVPFGVAYGTDKELVRKAVLEAARQVEHTLLNIPGREPQVWLVGFGDSSLDFELVVWIQPESVKRPAAVNAAYYWAIETALNKYGIEIPFPQRDLHIRSGRLPIISARVED